MTRRTRRQFVRDAAIVTTAAAGAKASRAVAEPADTPHDAFTCDWNVTPDRVWIGPDYWANPLQDWRIASGRLECIHAAPDRHLHLLTWALGEQSGGFSMSVRLGRIDGNLDAGAGSAGFRIGIRGELPDFRNALLFGRGLDAGISSAGKLFIGSPVAADSANVKLATPAIELRLAAMPSDRGYTLVLTALDAASGQILADTLREAIPAEQLVGNLALVANFGQARPNRPRRQGAAIAGPGSGKFWFANWRAGGTKLSEHPERAFGPILFSQYTLSRGTLKLTAQMPPVGARDTQVVELEVEREGKWIPIAEAPIDPDSRTATFRVDDWDETADAPYRVTYDLLNSNGESTTHIWPGTVRRDPVDRDILTVADVSCNGHMAFPNAEYVANMARLDPDLLAFTGDQFYESSGGYGVQRGPLEMAMLDLLRKWYLHGWTWRTLMRDRPSVSIPDDHDVYQGNIWGEAGAARHGTQEMGGYDMPPEWVNVVHRTQTSHHPDPYDPAPGKRGISVYFGPLVYGGVSFAILADRQFKSGPEGKVTPTGDRGDHVVDSKYDPRTADLPGLELLGERQMAFLRDWIGDWRGAQMKAVISQTIFTAMATTHGPNREILWADYDANGWPQSARNAALRELRKALAFHIAGDQHLPAVVRYGIDRHGDAVAALAGPPVNNIYPRWFEPQSTGRAADPSATTITGDFRDHFGNPLTVLAVANPKLEFQGSVLEVERDKSCGLALVRFDKPRRRVTVECWPLLVDPLQPDTQFAGWPVTIDPLADSRRVATAWLPTLKIAGARDPLVQVLADDKLVYNLRIVGDSFQPHVFAPGVYSVRVVDAESGRERRIDKLAAGEKNDATIEVQL